MISHRPAVIAQVEAEDDVIAALANARDERLPAPSAAVGTTWRGSRSATALVVDLTPMAGVTVDPAARRARVQGGATWGALDAAAQAHGLATPGGVVSETGVAGLTLSGASAGSTQARPEL